MKIETLPISQLTSNSFRDTWTPGDSHAPKAFNDLVELLTKRAKIHALPIHVSQGFRVLDGHVALDIYRSFGRIEVEVIVHPEITSQTEAEEFYIAANYLRSAGWLRSGVKLRNNLASMGPNRAVMVMPDATLATDLIRRSQEQWDKYSTVFIDPTEAQAFDALFD